VICDLSNCVVARDLDRPSRSFQILQTVLLSVSKSNIYNARIELRQLFLLSYDLHDAEQDLLATVSWVSCRDFVVGLRPCLSAVMPTGRVEIEDRGQQKPLGLLSRSCRAPNNDVSLRYSVWKWGLCRVLGSIDNISVIIAQFPQHRIYNDDDRSSRYFCYASPRVKWHAIMRLSTSPLFRLPVPHGLRKVTNVYNVHKSS